MAASEDLTGSLLQASWESLQLEPGLVGLIFEYPEQVHHYQLGYPTHWKPVNRHKSKSLAQTPSFASQDVETSN